MRDAHDGRLTKPSLRLGWFVTFRLIVVGTRMDPATVRRKTNEYVQDDGVSVMVWALRIRFG